MKNKLIFLLLKLLALLPLSWARVCGRLLARILILSGSRSWLVTQKNIELCYPNFSAEESDDLARRSVTETSKSFFEVPRIFSSNWQQLQSSVVAIENEALLESALADERGLVLLGPHLGNWEVFSSYLSEKTAYMAMYKPTKNTELDAYIIKSRSQGKSEVEMIPTNLRGVMALMKGLKKGKTTIILPDQVPTVDAGGDFASFFGLPALTMTLLHKLYHKTNCQFLMAYVLREEKGFKIVFREVDPAIYDTEEAKSLEALNRSVENCVADAPAQYQWEYKRFRRQPDGQHSPYD